MTIRLLNVVAICLACSIAVADDDAAGNATALPTNESIDLLEMVKLPDHRVRGTWKKKDGSLVCDVSPDALLMFPVAVKAGYELECEFTRRAGAGSFGVVCPVGGLSTLVTISGWKGAVSGLGKVNGKIAPELPVSSGAVVKPGKIENGKRYRLQIACIQNRGRVWIKATLNQRPFINWKGPPEALASSPGWGVPCPETIGIFVTGSSLADIHKLQLTVARGGEAYRLGDDFQNPISAPSPSPPKEIVDKCINRNGRYYVFSQKPINIIEAQMLAAKLKGRLLTISSAEEEAFILKEGRGISLWMSGWRQSATRDWRDERNRPLRFIGRWARSQPMLRGFWETRLAIHTAAGTGQGWHDYPIARKNHACIEWGEEYPAAE